MPVKAMQRRGLWDRSLLGKIKKASQSKKATILQCPKSTNEYILKPNLKKFMQRNYAYKYRKPIEMKQKASHTAVRV